MLRANGGRPLGPRKNKGVLRGGPKKDASGQLVFALPMGERKLPGIAAADIGGCAYGVFVRGQEMVGRTVGIAGEHLTGAQMASELSTALGQPVRYQSIPFEACRRLGFPGAEDLGNMCVGSIGVVWA